MLKNLRKRLKDQKGLTLIELLAVIVILGIIAAIAIPSIGGLINKTKEDAKVAEAVQIVNAAKLFITTNPTADSMDQDDLEQYLDNVNDKEFSVSVTNTDGKYSYTLKNHDAVPIVMGSETATSVTEEKLLQYSGN
ncbi:prepilin-type N-terminal cleavage/methylation domain-containing protein [Cytobacillus oceanisediminis]|uniref:prepilin-type N-terminal cleavage/methylation domain-containing protein n=1 Tax=Cytobacillus oceanisediminis TaxID=665099 RepID=UPI001D157161|nr:prepilin-type N-terminal cleavage/methylation domain-containing protein [Cytobacillus oceanisediminis]MCC3647498.1 prepilin-type N-terminal cleavage/methylation domain-containing protein [Cytobacillus oceanisediminis]